jgi:hypothetical protein
MWLTNWSLDQGAGKAEDNGMTTRFCRYLKAASIVAMVVATAPHAGGQDQDVMIARVLKMSGISAQVRALDQTLLFLLPPDAFPNSKTRDVLVKSLTKAVNDEALLALVHNSVKENFRADWLEEVLEFYRGRVGQKVGRQQSTALDSSVLRSIREGRRAVTTLEGARLANLKRIVRSGRFLDSNSELLRSFVWGFVEGFSGNPDNQQGVIPFDLTAIGNSSAFSAERTEDQAMLALAYTFQSLSDKEMEELAAFQESEAAIWFHTAVLKGSAIALYQTARALGASMKPSDEKTSPHGKQR